MPLTIGEFIASRREAMGLTQSELAELLGVRQSTIGNWESGRNDVRRHQFVAVAEALQVAETEWPAAMKLPTSPEEAA